MKLSILSIIATLLTFSIYSQDINIMEGTKTMKEGSYKAYSVELNEISASDAEDAWKDFMEQYKSKTSKDKKAKLLFSDNVQLPTVSSNPVDVYTMVNNDGRNGSVVIIWFDTGNGYVNSIDMEPQSQTAKSIVYEYAFAVKKKAADQELKKEENALSDIINDLQKLNEKNSNLAKDISKAQDQIKKLEKELEQNEDNIIKKKKAVSTQELKTEMAKEKARKYL